MARLRVKKSELNYPRPLRNGRKFAPLPDLATYWQVIGFLSGPYYWKLGRAPCSKCGEMFTLGKEGGYIGRSVTKNRMHYSCAGGKPPFKRYRERKPPWLFHRKPSRSSPRSTRRSEPMF